MAGLQTNMPAAQTFSGMSKTAIEEGKRILDLAPMTMNRTVIVFVTHKRSVLKLPTTITPLAFLSSPAFR